MTDKYCDLLIIDDIYPSAFSPFRTLEYNHYMWFFDASMLALEGWHLWIENNQLKDNIANALLEPKYKERVLDFREHHNIASRLAYVTFLGNAHRLLPYFQSREIPFILQLYPGGTFAIDQDDIDKKLDEVLSSPLCRKVITTQTITRDYIVNKIGCDPAKVEFIFGGVFDSRIDFDFYRDKKLYGVHKDTIDLCFVAHKYGGDLTSKGYDYFIRIAEALSGKFNSLKFHVVGDYSPDDIPLNELSDKFTFYGKQSSAFFADFYPRMDAIISFNRPFVLAPGAFDGFPTGACLEAGFRGVANCINDPLGLNATFVDGVDLLILDNDFEKSVATLSGLIADHKKLRALGEGTWRAFHRTMDLDRQLWARTKIIGDELLKHKGLVSVVPAARSSVDAQQLRDATYQLRLHNEQLQSRIAHLEHDVAGSSVDAQQLRDAIYHLRLHNEQLQSRIAHLEHDVARSSVDAQHLRDAALHNEQLQSQIAHLEHDVAHWRRTSEILAKGVANRIFEKTKSVVRRYRNNRRQA